MSARILLVEDEPGLVITLTDLLTAEGYTVESAADGITGLARAGKTWPSSCSRPKRSSPTV